MGATVLLFNRYERIIQRSLTNERGAFGFESLPPDLYSVRVSLTSFMPAMKHLDRRAARYAEPAARQPRDPP